MGSHGPTGTATVTANRWLQLIAGVVCMVAAANIQYSWTLFVPEIQNAHGWSRASIQIAFTVFVVVQTWLTPIEGYFIDKYGPRAVVLVGGFFTGLSWIVNSYATSLTGFYVGAAIGGIGVGCVYSTCVNSALKWFPDKRGLAVGLTAAGYGSGTVLTIMPIANMLKTSGYQETFFLFGLIQGAIILLAAGFLRAPQKGEVTFSSTVAQSRRDYTLGEALRTPVFYVMLTMFILTVTGGLMAVAQLGVIAEDLGVKKVEVNLYFFAMAALPFALMLDRILNGISRPLFGWISDHIGREKTMFFAFAMEGIGIVALGTFGHNPWAFIILSGIVFLAWGEVYSLFSATAADTFGSAHVGKIYGVLYCAKGVAALLVPVANLIMEATGSWATVLYIVAAMDLTAAFCALFVLRPLLARHHRLNEEAAARATRQAPVGA
ncbi:oxalate/formate MFS antiporter [Aquabacter sp. P-9]|uniref:oxalate/formate MFS antiporter n=1 Tax=Aquabacter sediminis TaxID=3029197 RepID=UPI00237D98C1|nr:oxalate/formate MFS antiporter [Aquabacter sp. P-9]MDE1570545.1 oxalate/formate MFS antiporter [Aquabacter sp. P-9]